MTGLSVERVSAFTGAFELPVDLVDSVSLRFTGGALGVLGSTGSVNPEHPELLEYRIFGRDGHLLMDVNNGQLEWRTSEGIERLPVLPEADRYPEGAPVRNLIELARGEGVNGSPAELGLAVVEVVDAIYRSASEKRAVAVGEA
jgi:predicted dehydrogenase